MAVTYPLAIPTVTSPVSMRFNPQFVVGESVSPFSFQGEYFDWQGQQMVIDVTLPPLVERADAEEWIAWGLSLNGVLGTFTMGLYGDQKTPRGTMAGTPLVSGAGQQRSQSLVTSGWTALSDIVKKGDYIQVGSYLYRNLNDVTAASDGTATLDLFPRIREVLTDGQSIIVTDPVGLWRLVEPFPWDVELLSIHGISFKIKEAL